MRRDGRRLSGTVSQTSRGVDGNGRVSKLARLNVRTLLRLGFTTAALR